MKTYIKIILSLILTFTSIHSYAQIDMTQANDGLLINMTDCDTSIQDAGAAIADYDNNQNVTITICPQNAGDKLSALFNVFDLANSAACNTGTNQNPVFDYLEIFDGNSDAANSLGSYTGNALQNVLVQATTLNPSGCLTFKFTSNAICTGNFAASISCNTPCDPPVSNGIIVNGSAPDSIAVCVGETVNFQEQGSFAQNGFNLVSYEWDFRDGNTASGQNVSNVFNAPGEYLVNLTVTDDNTNTTDGNPCTNANILELQVLVAPPPTFDNFPVDDEVCIGESITLNAPVTTWSNEWSGFPTGVTVDDGCFGDDVGVLQTTPLPQTGFVGGATMNNLADLQSICIEMEHSYVGDLVVQLRCPNGSIVTLHQQGGAGAFLGEPVDNGVDVDCSDPSTIGVPYEYCFTPSATETWVEYINNQGGLFGQPIPAGDYESIDPLSGLIGCPLNGEWQLWVTDNLGADDGTVTSFSLNFDPSYYAPVTTFEPVLGSQSDSSSWQPGGSFITNTSADGNQITIEPTSDGTFQYTFNVTDNFGCTNDSTFTLTVDPLAQAFAGNDTTICSGDASTVNLNGSIGGTGAACDYQLILDDSFGDGWNGNEIVVTAGGTNTTYTVATGTQNIVVLSVNHGDNLVLDFNDIGNFIGECEITLLDGQGNIVYQSGQTGNPDTAPQLFTADCFGGMTFEWSPAGMVSDASIPNPTLNISAPQTFSLSVYPTGHPLCVTSDDVNIAFSTLGDAGTDGTLDICSDGTPVDLFGQLGGTPDAGGAWTDAGGNPVTMPYDPATFTPGVYTYTVDNAGCVTSAIVTVTEIEITVNFDVTDADCGTACNGDVTITPAGGIGAYQYSTDNGGSFDPNNVISNLCPGNYAILIEDQLGCQLTINPVIDEINVPALDPTPGEDVTVTNVDCFGADNGVIQIDVLPNVVNYTLERLPLGSGLNVTQTNGTFANLSPGVYKITVDNGFGCSESTNVTINEPDQLAMNFIVADTVVCPGGNVWLTCSATGGSSDYIYSWTENGTVIGNTKDLSVPNSPVGGATYCVTVSEQCGSVPTDTCMTVTNPVAIFPRFTGSPLTGCYPVESTFNNNSTNGGAVAQVEWDFGDGSTGTSFGMAPISHSYNEAGLFDVSMTVTSVIGCVYDTTYVNYVEAYEYPIANFSNDPASPSMYNAETTFSELASPDVVSWLWDFGAVAIPSTSTEMNPHVVYPDAEYGTYPAQLIVTNANGCTDTSNYNVIVQSEVLIYAPNTFTPDGDVYNEEWRVHMEGIDIYDFDLFIYNRWGEVVWESHDASKGWDGMFAGKPIMDGTYVWVIRTKDLENDEKYTFKGTVNVLR